METTLTYYPVTLPPWAWHALVGFTDLAVTETPVSVDTQGLPRVSLDWVLAAQLAIGRSGMHPGEWLTLADRLVEGQQGRGPT